MTQSAAGTTYAQGLGTCTGDVVVTAPPTAKSLDVNPRRNDGTNGGGPRAAPFPLFSARQPGSHARRVEPARGNRQAQPQRAERDRDRPAATATADADRPPIGGGEAPQRRHDAQAHEGHHGQQVEEELAAPDEQPRDEQRRVAAERHGVLPRRPAGDVKAATGQQREEPPPKHRIAERHDALHGAAGDAARSTGSGAAAPATSTARSSPAAPCDGAGGTRASATAA